MQRRRSPASFSLALMVFLTNCALVHSTEANFWLQRQSSLKNKLPHNEPFTSKASLPDKLNPVPSGLRGLVEALPYQQAHLQDFFLSKENHAPSVLIIQDVHMNSQAQLNIASLLRNWVEKCQVGVVGIEGAFNRFDFSQFQSLSNRSVVEEVAKSFLLKNRLGAPSYVGLTSGGNSIPFIGVDDREQYEKNVEAYLNSQFVKKQASENLEELNKIVNQEAQSVLSKALYDFVSIRDKFHTGQIGLGDYVAALASFGLTPGSQLSQFLEAYQMELDIDYEKVEQEKATLLDKLASKLNEKETREFLSKSLAYRFHQAGFAHFFKTFEQMCVRKGITFDGAPHFKRYLRYVFLTESIQSVSLFRGVADYEERVVQHLNPSNNEYRIVQKKQWVRLSEKLIDFSLTSEEWERYKKLKNSLRIKANHASFEPFYEKADVRSQKMVANLFSVSDLSKPLVLITGGFHTALISQLLKKEKISYAVVSPKISVIDDAVGSAYLSVFAQEKTPLDKLFSGKTLFLKPAVQEVSNPATLVRLKASVMARIGRWVSYKSVTLRLAHGSNSFNLKVMKGAEPADDRYQLDREVRTVIREFIYQLPLVPVLMDPAVLNQPWIAAILWGTNLLLAYRFSKDHGENKKRQAVLFSLGLLLGGVILVSDIVNRFGWATIFISIGIHFLYNHIVHLTRFFSSQQWLTQLFPSLKAVSVALPLATIRDVGMRIQYPLTPLHALHRGRIWRNPQHGRPPAELLEEHFQQTFIALKGSIERTPLVPLEGIGRITGRKVFLKDESAQVGGSFKARGVYYEVLMAIERVIADKNQWPAFEKGLKIVTQSTGNHGIALIRSTTKIIEVLLEKYKAYPDIVQNLKKIEPIVFTLSTLPSVKRRDMEAALQIFQAKFGADRGALRDEYLDYAKALAARTAYIEEQQGAGLYMEHSGRDIMLGHGTAGIEIAEQLAEAGIGPDKKVVLIIPVGAGGPIGIAAALKSFRGNAKAVMVQSKRWDALIASLKTGKLQKNPENIPPTFTIVEGNSRTTLTFPDGIAVDAPEGAAVEDAKRYLDAGISASEKKAFQQAAVLLWRDLRGHYKDMSKIKVGGTTALTAEALLSFLNDMPELQEADAVVLFGTEGNVDPLVLKVLEKQQAHVQMIEDMYRSEMEGNKGPDAIRYRSSIFPYAPSNEKEREIFEALRKLVSSWWSPDRLKAVQALNTLADDLESGKVQDPTGHLRAALYWAEEPLQDLNGEGDLHVAHAVDHALQALHHLQGDAPLLPHEFRREKPEDTEAMMTRVERIDQKVVIAADPLFDLIDHSGRDRRLFFSIPDDNSADTPSYSPKKRTGSLWRYILVLGRWLPEALRFMRVAITGDVLMLRASSVLEAGEEELNRLVWKGNFLLGFFRFPETTRTIIRRTLINSHNFQEKYSNGATHMIEIDDFLADILVDPNSQKIVKEIFTDSSHVSALKELVQKSRPSPEDLTLIREQALRFRILNGGPTYPQLISDWMRGENLPATGKEDIEQAIKQVTEKSGPAQSPINLKNAGFFAIAVSVASWGILYGVSFSPIAHHLSMFVFLFTVYVYSFLILVLSIRLAGLNMRPRSETGPPARLFGRTAVSSLVAFIQFNHKTNQVEVNSLLYSSLTSKNPLLRFFSHFLLTIFSVGSHERTHSFGIKNEVVPYFVQFSPGAIVIASSIAFSDTLAAVVLIGTLFFSLYSAQKSINLEQWVKKTRDGKKRTVYSIDELKSLIQLAHQNNRTVGLVGSFESLKSGRPISVQIFNRVFDHRKYPSLLKGVHALAERLGRIGVVEASGQWRPFLKIKEDGIDVIYAAYLPGQAEPLVFDGHIPEKVLTQAELVVYFNLGRAHVPGNPRNDQNTPRLDDPTRRKLNPKQFIEEKPEAHWIRWQGPHHAWRIFLNQYPIFPQKTGRAPEEQPYNLLIVRDDEPASQLDVAQKTNLEDFLALMSELHGQRLREFNSGNLTKIAEEIIRAAVSEGKTFNLSIAPSAWMDQSGFRIHVNGWLAGASQGHAHAHASRMIFPIERVESRWDFISDRVQVRVREENEWGSFLHLHDSGINMVIHIREKEYPRPGIHDGYDLMSRFLPIFDASQLFVLTESEREEYNRLATIEERSSWIKTKRKGGGLTQVNSDLPRIARAASKKAAIPFPELRRILSRLKTRSEKTQERSSGSFENELESALQAWAQGKEKTLEIIASDASVFRFQHQINQSNPALHSILVFLGDKKVGYFDFRLGQYFHSPSLIAEADFAHPAPSRSLIETHFRLAIDVDPEISGKFQGVYRGVGQTLMSLGERLVYRMGAREFVGESTPEAKSFYERMGYGSPNEATRGMDWLYMRKILSPDTFPKIGITRQKKPALPHSSMGSFAFIGYPFLAGSSHHFEFVVPALFFLGLGLFLIAGLVLAARGIVRRHLTGNARKEGAKWLADVGAALLRKDAGSLVAIKPLGVARWGVAVQDSEAALLARLEGWVKEPAFHKILAKEFKKIPEYRFASDEERETFINLLIAIVLSKQDVPETTSRLLLFTRISRDEQDRQIRDIAVMRMLVSGDAQTKTHFVVDSEARPEIEAAIRAAKSYGMVVGSIAITENSELLRQPVIRLDYLNEIFNSPRLIILPGRLRPADAPSHVLAFEEWMGPLMKVDLATLLQALRAVLTAA